MKICPHCGRHNEAGCRWCHACRGYMFLPFRMSFGCRFAREPHPVFPQAHPDGWLTIWADDARQAREGAWELFTGAWSDMYGPESWDEMTRSGEVAGFWPAGELGQLQIVPGWRPNKPGR